MLTEIAVSAILTASITGAGLIIAIYALMTPIARKIFEERVEMHRKKKKKFDEMKEKINAESSEKDFKQLKMLSMEIKEIRIFPRYLGFGVLAVFTLYLFTAIGTVGWLMNPTLEDFARDFLLAALFFISTVGFLGVGYSAIIDVSRTMKEEFEQVKKEKEEVEKVRRELEQLKKKMEEAKSKAEREGKVKLKPKYTKEH